MSKVRKQAKKRIEEVVRRCNARDNQGLRVYIGGVRDVAQDILADLIHVIGPEQLADAIEAAYGIAMEEERG